MYSLILYFFRKIIQSVKYFESEQFEGGKKIEKAKTGEESASEAGDVETKAPSEIDQDAASTASEISVASKKSTKSSEKKSTKTTTTPAKESERKGKRKNTFTEEEKPSSKKPKKS